jgi:uncharacterized protein involved in exopolysaccharide biosynthesis
MAALEIAESRPRDLPRKFDGYPDLPSQVTTIAALRRRWRFVAGVIVAALLATYFVCSMLTPLYAAKTSIMIEPREPKRPISSADPDAALPPSEETIRKNEMALMRSRNLADAVVARLSLDQQPEYNPLLSAAPAPKGWLERLKSLSPLSQPTEATKSESPEQRGHELAVDKFLERLGTTSTDASRVIEIRFLSEDPVRAAQIANTVAEEYISQKQNQAQEEANFATRLFGQDTEDLNRKIRDGERMIEQMRDHSGLLPGTTGKMIVEHLSDVNRQLATAVEERMLAEGKFKQLQSARDPDGSDSAAPVLDSPLIQRLQGDAALLAAKVAEMSTQYSETHPKLVGARAELNDQTVQKHARLAGLLLRIVAAGLSLSALAPLPLSWCWKFDAPSPSQDAVYESSRIEPGRPIPGWDVAQLLALLKPAAQTAKVPGWSWQSFAASAIGMCAAISLSAWTLSAIGPQPGLNRSQSTSARIALRPSPRPCRAASMRRKTHRRRPRLFPRPRCGSSVRGRPSSTPPSTMRCSSRSSAAYPAASWCSSAASPRC